LVGRVDRPANRELRDGDDAFRLVADVDEDLVLVHAHDGAVDDLSLVDRGEGRLVVRDELAVRAFDPDARLIGHLLLLKGFVGHQERVSIAPSATSPAAIASGTRTRPRAEYVRIDGRAPTLFAAWNQRYAESD